MIIVVPDPSVVADGGNIVVASGTAGVVSGISGAGPFVALSPCCPTVT